MDQKILIDPSNLTRESIVNEYFNLCKHYKEAKQLDNTQLQEIHQLKRELHTALSDKDHLSSELDIVNSEHSKEIEILQQKHRDELNEYKHSLSTYKNELELVEADRDKLEMMVENLKKQHLEDKQINADVPADNNQSVHTEKLAQLEYENDELAEVVENLKSELTDALKTNLQFEKQIEDLVDRLRCAKENLQTKRDELEEKNELYETAQERVIQLSGELNAVRSESDTASKRGNSLFAEVDDQRQKMKALLQAQKANYVEMKNELEESRQVIRKLKRENAAMYKEIDVCSHIFLNAEQHHTEKLNERVGELMKENEAINKKLIFTEQCLSDMIKKNDAKWLDPMLLLCKNETSDLKDKLYRCSLQKVNIAATLRKSEEDTARWRFEALKSRCIIADRESLLEENKIPFSIVSGIDKKIRNIDNENVSPNIASGTSRLGFKRRSLTKLQSPLNSDMKNVISVNASKRVEPSNHIGESLDNGNVEGSIELEVKLVSHIESTSKVVTTETDNLADAKKMSVMDENPVQQSVFKSPCSSGVTVRKKNNSLKTPVLWDCDNSSTAHLRTPGTCLPSLIRPKIDFMKNSTGGILKLSTSANIHSDKKVKFDPGSVGKKDMEKPSSVRKLEKVDSVPKTAIRKRIFISSKKPTNNSQ